MVKTITLKRAKKEAWKAFSDYIRERDNWTCFTCKRQTKKGMHCGHFYPAHRGGILLRFDEKNCNAQCYDCNIHLGSAGMLYSIAFRKKYGFEADIELLKYLPASKAFKVNRQWYLDTKKKYEALREADMAIKEAQRLP